MICEYDIEIWGGGGGIGDGFWTGQRALGRTVTQKIVKLTEY